MHTYMEEFENSVQLLYSPEEGTIKLRLLLTQKDITLKRN